MKISFVADEIKLPHQAHLIFYREKLNEFIQLNDLIREKGGFFKRIKQLNEFNKN